MPDFGLTQWPKLRDRPESTGRRNLGSVQHAGKVIIPDNNALRSRYQTRPLRNLPLPFASGKGGAIDLGEAGFTGHVCDSSGDAPSFPIFTACFAPPLVKAVLRHLSRRKKLPP